MEHAVVGCLPGGSYWQNMKINQVELGAEITRDLTCRTRENRSIGRDYWKVGRTLSRWPIYHHHNHHTYCRDRTCQGSYLQLSLFGVPQPSVITSVPQQRKSPFENLILAASPEREDLWRKFAKNPSSRQDLSCSGHCPGSPACLFRSYHNWKVSSKACCSWKYIVKDLAQFLVGWLWKTYIK